MTENEHIFQADSQPQIPVLPKNWQTYSSSKSSNYCQFHMSISWQHWF